MFLDPLHLAESSVCHFPPATNSAPTRSSTAAGVESEEPACRKVRACDDHVLTVFSNDDADVCTARWNNGGRSALLIVTGLAKSEIVAAVRCSRGNGCCIIN